MLKIIFPNDNWILQKIGQELVKANITLKADVNYYINWMYWKYLGCKKSNCDVVFFTHIDSDSDISVLGKADWIFCMSEHGRHELKKYNLDGRAKVIAGFGLSVQDRKIRLGIAGRPYRNGRKGQQVISNLYDILDKDIFEFVFASNWQLNIGRVSGDFFNDIDWLFIASDSEGGPMDALNAKALNIPVVSKDIGFMYSLKDEDDIVYENYDVLLLKLKQLEEKIKYRKKLLSVHTWDNFIDWHKREFSKIEDCNLYSNNGQ